LPVHRSVDNINDWNYFVCNNDYWLHRKYDDRHDCNDVVYNWFVTRNLAIELSKTMLK
jgi:hypothetical protein